MIKLLERILISIYRFFVKRRLYRTARRYGFEVSDFEWLPPSKEVERIVRITPTEDGYIHTGDDCPCKPIKRVQTIDRFEYSILQHREMT